MTDGASLRVYKQLLRKLFAAASSKVGELRTVVWVNPKQSEEEPILWLENGARAERKRLLRIQAERGK